jgi:hypothetical protein
MFDTLKTKPQLSTNLVYDSNQDTGLAVHHNHMSHKSVTPSSINYITISREDFIQHFTDFII